MSKCCVSCSGIQPLQEHRTACPRYLSGAIPLLLSTQHRPMSSVILSHNKGENDQVVRITTWRSGETWRISFRDTSCVGVHVKAVCVDLEMNLISLLFLLAHRRNRSFWDRTITKKDQRATISERRTWRRSGWRSATRPCAMSSASCLMP